MIKKIGKFPYDISEFEKKAEKLFHDQDIWVGTIDGADEEMMQNFLEDVIKYEIADKNLKEKNI